MAATKDMIQDCVLELMLSRDISKIKVKEITEHLQISRQTFYLYYDSVYAVVQQAQDEFLEQISCHLSQHSFYPIDDRYFNLPNPAILDSLKFYREHHKKYLSLSGPNGSPMFIHSFNKYINQHIIDRACSMGYILIEPETKPFIVEYMTNGYTSIVHTFLEKPPTLNDAQLAVLIYRLMFGPFRKHPAE